MQALCWVCNRRVKFVLLQTSGKTASSVVLGQCFAIFGPLCSASAPVSCPKRSLGGHRFGLASFHPRILCSGKACQAQWALTVGGFDAVFGVSGVVSSPFWAPKDDTTVERCPEPSLTFGPRVRAAQPTTQLLETFYRSSKDHTTSSPAGLVHIRNSSKLSFRPFGHRRDGQPSSSPE